MEIQKRGDTKIIPNHALDTIGNQSEAKRSWTDESEDEALLNDVNEDSFNPFGYGDAWALSLF